MHARSTAATVLVLLLATPAASAVWMVHGSFEPDTADDVAGGHMWTEPFVDGSSQERVYFNGVLVYSYSGVNPNVGALQSRLMVDGLQDPIAWLGLWKDCNGDGYIGMAEGALSEYDVALLPSTDICPDTSRHVKSGWVYEFLWVGPGTNGVSGTHQFPHLVSDLDAAVWGDIGRPGDQPTSLCYTNPPTGTFSSTGGILGYVDCSTGHTVATAITLVDPTGELGFGEQNEQPGCSDSLLNVRRNVFADDPRCPTGQTGLLEHGSEDPAFTAWDCSAYAPVRDPTAPEGEQGDLSQVRDPTGGQLAGPIADTVTIFSADDRDLDLTFEDGYYTHLPAVAANPTLEPEGSLYDGANGAVSLCADTPLLPALPVESAVTSGKVKRETTFYFEFTDDIGTAFMFGVDKILLGDDTPPYAGVGVARTSAGQLGFGWYSYISATGSVILRDTATEGPSSYTWYARVGASTTAVAALPSNGGTYGSEWCGTATTGIVGLVDCDADTWWDPAQGASDMPKNIWDGREIGQRIGAHYDLRDVDCYDGSVSEAYAPGIFVGQAVLGGDCPTVA